MSPLVCNTKNCIFVYLWNTDEKLKKMFLTNEIKNVSDSVTQVLEVVVPE